MQPMWGLFGLWHLGIMLLMLAFRGVVIAGRAKHPMALESEGTSGIGSGARDSAAALRPG